MQADLSGDLLPALITKLEKGLFQGKLANTAATEGGDAWSDESLVDSIVQRGNPQHFTMLLARYKVKVHLIALSVLGPSQQAQAEDVAQEVFIRLYQRLDTFKGDCRFSTWLYRLAVNAAIDFQRRNQRHAGVDVDLLPLQGSGDSAAESLETEDTSARVQRAVQSLPHSQRMMVHLFYWLEFKIREIAEVLDCPEGTVKVYLSRAKQHLAHELGGQWDE